MVWVLFFNVLFTLNTSFAYRWPPKRISGWCAPLPPQLSHKHCMPEFIWNLKKIRGPCLVVFLFCEMCVCVCCCFCVCSYGSARFGSPLLRNIEDRDAEPLLALGWSSHGPAGAGEDLQG